MVIYKGKARGSSVYHWHFYDVNKMYSRPCERECAVELWQLGAWEQWVVLKPTTPSLVSSCKGLSASSFQPFALIVKVFEYGFKLHVPVVQEMSAENCLHLSK